MVDEIEKMLFKVRGRQGQNFVASIKDFLPWSELTFEPARIVMAKWHGVFNSLLPLSDKSEKSTVDWIGAFEMAKELKGEIPTPWPVLRLQAKLGRSWGTVTPCSYECENIEISDRLNDTSDSDYEDVQHGISDSDYEDVQNGISYSEAVQEQFAVKKEKEEEKWNWLPPITAVIKIQRTFRAYLRRSHAVQKIQRTFRAYLMRRSQALQAYRELALLETKLGDIRFLFNDLSYLHRVSRDAEECQRFAEKIIILLLTVDAIKGINEMIRSFKKSMVDELEAMLDVVDKRVNSLEKFLASIDIELQLEKLHEKYEKATDHWSVLLRRAFLRRVGKGKEKWNELSPVDAVIKIQRSYRDYLVRKSQALQAYRDLAVVGTKLKEIKCLFNDFSYRRHLARDAKERQKFAEKIIVLILTADAIVGVNMMIRGSKNCVINELEAMLDVVDPQPPATDLRRS